jgi:hypothetical protein
VVQYTTRQGRLQTTAAAIVRLPWRRIRLVPDSLRSLRDPSFDVLHSQAPSLDQVTSARYRRWFDTIRADNPLHRKNWEWCYILEAFAQAGFLRAGASALGFGVGGEPCGGVGTA